ncbi:MAG: hypothetical protein ACD_37C00630G0007 [uncultured bacterium]|nr:MAG: hypothetical protein ACD_37C00630G0007 [uncultured bacterium]
MDKLETCRQTRKIASDSLYKALAKLLKSKKPISEVILRDAWISEMQKSKDIFPEGWYDPPPHGIIILFATDNNTKRLNFKSARPEEVWPRDDIFLDRKKGIALLYSSPVDKKSGIIGDFEMTLYFGKNKIIKNQLKTNLDIIKKIFEEAKKDMRLSDICLIGSKLLKQNKFVNIVYSVTDPTSTNLGHTVPFSYEDMNAKERKLLKLGGKNWKEFRVMISKKRKFVNTIESLTFKAPIAVTIEPRSKIKNKKDSPLVAFHGIILFKENGEKELLTNFDKIFKLVGMTYMS